jgi:hypothetical protein
LRQLTNPTGLHLLRGVPTAEHNSSFENKSLDTQSVVSAPAASPGRVGPSG